MRRLEEAGGSQAYGFAMFPRLPSGKVMAISRPAGQLPDSGRTLYSIQYLRALAACSVIFPHTSWTGQVGGQQGVDVFFVISGFIMMFVSTRESEPIEFIRSRAIRIIPLYWLATLATALISTPGWRHSLLSALFVPHIDPNGGMYPVVLQGWTLVYEVFFYLIFAVCLCFSRRIQLLALTGVLMILVLLGLIYDPRSPIGHTYLNGLLLEFVAGCWLYKLYESRLVVWPAAIGISMVALGLLGFVVLPTDFPEVWRPVFWGIPALLIVTAMLSLEKRLPKSRLLLLAGNASYAIYLTHYFWLHTLKNLVRPLPLPVALSVIVGVCVLLGILIHVLVEKPLSKALRSFVSKGGRGPILAAPDANQP